MSNNIHNPVGQSVLGKSMTSLAAIITNKELFGLLDTYRSVTIGSY